MTAPSWPAAGSSPDEVYAAVTAYAESRGLELYPHQDEAVIELLAGSNVVLATPTGSGKSLVALAAHAAALASDRVSFYTAPIKALVSEKFFDLCQVFGAEDVGMLTGDGEATMACRLFGIGLALGSAPGEEGSGEGPGRLCPAGTRWTHEEEGVYRRHESAT